MEDMKANELMIGDKVMVKVLSQIPDTYVLHTWTANDYSRDIQVKPIPLTPEILEKNGWKRHKIFMDIKADENFNINFSWTDRYGESLFQNGYYMCDCKYVHTLQHALRLCGLDELDELADNFKV